MKSAKTGLTASLTDPGLFVGRVDEVQELERALLAGKGRTVLIVGVYGVGKTALAAHFIDRHRADFPGGVAFLRPEEREEPSRVVDHIRDRLGNAVNSRAQLLVLDELEWHGQRRATNLVALIKRNFPGLSILATAPRSIPGFGAELRLGDLTSREMLLLWERLSDKLPAEEFYKFYDRVGGNPRRASAALRLIQSGEASIADFDTYLTPFNVSGILGPDGNPVRRGSEHEIKLVSGAVAISDDILDRLRRDPNGMQLLTPRQFEEVIAELLAKQGYVVTLTPASKDGGKDLYVAKKNSLGSFLYLVECKKYSRTRPVGVELIRQLYGVVEHEKATAGILATTSTFTKGAREWGDTVRYRLNLKDYMDLHKWIQDSGQLV